jgi:hypothetical protein
VCRKSQINSRLCQKKPAAAGFFSLAIWPPQHLEPPEGKRWDLVVSVGFFGGFSIFASRLEL